MLGTFSKVLNEPWNFKDHKQNTRVECGFVYGAQERLKHTLQTTVLTLGHCQQHDVVYGYPSNTVKMHFSKSLALNVQVESAFTCHNTGTMCLLVCSSPERWSG